MKLLELFAGVGSQYRALKNIGINLDESYISEIDKTAIQTYSLFHGHIPVNLGDIKKINTIPQVDLLTYSFPCQDISSQGYGKGLFNGQRSSLLWEVGRILKNSPLPEDLLMENVSAILNPKHSYGLNKWMEELKELGYTNYLFKLDASDFGVAQHRERVFMVSRLKKDFACPVHTQKQVLRDILESEVNDRYYINEFLPYLDKTIHGNKIKHCKLTNMNFNTMKVVLLPDSICTTLQANANSLKHYKIYVDGKLRCLTEKEKVRLMGFTDDDYDKISQYSNHKIQHLMGNSIVVPVLEEIFKNLFY